MRRTLPTIIYFAGIVLLASMFSWSCARQFDSPWAVALQAPSASTPNPKPHSNHNPQHGGFFFMALDFKHHLEGVLLEPGTFKVYMYDAYTKPLPVEKVQKASGTVQIGDAADAPIVPLVVAKDRQTLIADLSKQLKLPESLTLSIRFPDSKPDARPEVFTFHFDHYCGE